MNTITIKAPVIKKNDGYYSTEGTVEITCDSSGNLSETLSETKKQVNEVLASLNSETSLLDSIREAERLIETKKNLLSELERKYAQAQKKYNALMNFLGRFGIDGKDYSAELRISSQPLLEATVDDEDDDDN